MPRGSLKELNLAAPPQVLQLSYGDTCRINTHFTYSGPAISCELYVAIGQIKPWPVGFDEILVDFKRWSIPATTAAKTYVAYADISISPAISPGTYDLYAKIRDIPGADIISPGYQNVIAILEEAPPPATYSLEISLEPPGWGYVMLNPGSHMVAETKRFNVQADAAVTLEAKAGYGYEFDHWGGIPAISGTATTKVLTMDQDRWVVAVFREAPVVGYTLELRRSPAVGFLPTKTPDKALYDRLNVVQIQAYPPVGYEFDYWMVNGSKRTYNPSSVIMMKDTIATAYYRSV